MHIARYKIADRTYHGILDGKSLKRLSARCSTAQSEQRVDQLDRARLLSG
jgi:hypothetical protein